ncbi:unnamed protein product [Miscanthus lutarioriparius]|uniref:ADP/ATP translocase n=1 Tax=Miscanthus lutarioriparius TaxID=422564 RepID=A0A811RNL8_9POAL|nr:unnamed protein product [Miscanthus lutarioriparius]
MGGAVHTVVAPIERVKLLLQTQDGNAVLLGRARRFRGFADCVARTVRDEGVLSLWRGNGTAVIRFMSACMIGHRKGKQGYDVSLSGRDLYRSILKDAGTSSDNKFTSIALSNLLRWVAAQTVTSMAAVPTGHGVAEDDDAVRDGGADVQQHTRLLEEDIQAGGDPVTLPRCTV